MDYRKDWSREEKEEFDECHDRSSATCKKQHHAEVAQRTSILAARLKP